MKHTTQQTILKILILFGGLLLAAAIPRLVFAVGGTTVAVSPEAAEIPLGETQEITVTVTGAVNVNAFDLTVTYDPAVLELVCAYDPNGTACWESGGFLQNLQVFLLSNTPGEFFMAAIQRRTPGQNGDGDLIRLTISGVNFSDPDGVTMEPDRQHGFVAVKMIPTALDDGYQQAKNTPLAVSAGEGVLANDSGGPGAHLAAALVSGLEEGQGTLNLAADGSFSYSPPEDFIGTVGFTYRACDGGICSEPAAVNIAVKTIPTAVENTYEGAENTPLVVGPEAGLLANDSGDPGALLTASLVAGIPAGEGTLSLAPDGGFSFTPPEDWTGETGFTYAACDELICSEPVGVTLVIKTVPSAQDDSYEMAAGTVFEIEAPGVLANDSGGEGALLHAVRVGGPDPDIGELILNENGGFTYAPPAGWTGTVAFTYQTCDGTICSSAASVRIAVKTVPITGDNDYEMTINEVLTVDAPGVLENDSGDPGAVLQVEQLSGLDPAQGVLEVFPDGGLIYTPPVDWRGVVSFTYRACDGTICSDAANVRIEVFPPRVPLSGSVSLQGQDMAAGVPFVLVGRDYGYTYAVETLNQEGLNLSMEKVVMDTYLVTTSQPRYLNLHPELGIYITLTEELELPPLMLKGGNSVWTDNVINIGDASVIGTFYNLTLEDLPAEALLGDVNFDGVVNIFDLSMVGGNYWLTSDEVYDNWLG